MNSIHTSDIKDFFQEAEARVKSIGFSMKKQKHNCSLIQLKALVEAMEGKLINGFQFLHNTTLWSPRLTKKSEMNKDVAQENQLLCSMLINDISNWRKWFVFLNLEFIRKGFLHFSKSYNPQRRSRNDQKSVISQKAFHVPRQQELNESHTLTAGQTTQQNPSAHTPHTHTPISCCRQGKTTHFKMDFVSLQFCLQGFKMHLFGSVSIISGQKPRVLPPSKCLQEVIL